MDSAYQLAESDPALTSAAAAAAPPPAPSLMLSGSEGREIQADGRRNGLSLTLKRCFMACTGGERRGEQQQQQQKEQQQQLAGGERSTEQQQQQPYQQPHFQQQQSVLQAAEALVRSMFRRKGAHE